MEKEKSERLLQMIAHRVCCSMEHDPLNGKIHGYCVVCGVPWPCKYAGPEPPSEGVEEKHEEALFVCEECGDTFPANQLPTFDMKGEKVCSECIRKLAHFHPTEKLKPVIEMCDERQHKFAKLPDHPTHNGLACCPYCMAKRLDELRSEEN